jgi:carbon monoxide dehydrogenase subunit G
VDLADSFTLPLPIDRAWDLLTDLERIAPCLPGAQLTEIEGDLHRGKVKIKVGPITAQFGGVARFTEKDDQNYRAVITAEGREARGQGNAQALVTASLTSVDGADGPGSATTVTVLTDLTISGKVAQFGRGVIADVSTKLISQFVANVEKMINDGEAASAAAPDAATQPATGIAGAEAAEAAVVPPTEPVEPSAPTDPVDTTRPIDAITPADSIASSDAIESIDAVEPPVPTVRKIDSPEVEAVDLFDLTGMPVAKRLAPVAGAVAILVALFVLLRRRRSH